MSSAELPWLQLGWTQTGLPWGESTGAYVRIGELFLSVDKLPSGRVDWSVRLSGDELAGGTSETLRSGKAAAVLHAGACVALVSAWNQRAEPYHCESCKAALEKYREPGT